MAALIRVASTLKAGRATGRKRHVPAWAPCRRDARQWSGPLRAGAMMLRVRRRLGIGYRVAFIALALLTAALGLASIFDPDFDPRPLGVVFGTVCLVMAGILVRMARLLMVASVDGLFVRNPLRSY